MHHPLEYAERCWHCGQWTNLVEISFHAFLCPGACTNAKWDEFAAACERAAALEVDFDSG